MRDAISDHRRHGCSRRRSPRRVTGPAFVALCALVALVTTLASCAPALAPAAPPPRQSSAPPWPYAFTVLSFNAYMLPRPWFDTDQQLRARLLIEHLSGYDAIVFQELFDDGVRATLLAGLATEYPYVSRVVGSGSGLFGEDGGVLVVSRWPIEAEGQIGFGEICAAVDCLADKGVIYARIVKGGRRYHLFGSHAQSDVVGGFPAVRDAQFRLFAAFVDAQAIPADDPVVLAGDFNVDCYRADEYEAMLRTLDATPIGACDGRYTWDGIENQLAGGRVRVFLDYVLLARGHARPLRAWGAVLPLRSDAYARRDLSDHFAVTARFLFPPLPTGSDERAIARLLRGAGTTGPSGAAGAPRPAPR